MDMTGSREIKERLQFSIKDTAESSYVTELMKLYQKKVSEK